MLLKFLFLIFLAYMISRTVGNLLRAVRGEGKRGTPIDSDMHRRYNQAFDVQNSQFDVQNSHLGNTGPGRNIRNESESSRSSDSNVEDAKWTDVQ